MKLNKYLIILFPIFFALPDLAINLGAINLRIGDLIIYLFFILNIKDIVNTKIHSFLKVQYYLMIYAIISLLIVSTYKLDLINDYEVIKFIGSIPYLFVLPIIFSNPIYRKYVFQGFAVGGAVYLVGLANNYSTLMLQSEILKTSGTFKREIAFDSLNPNAVASIGTIFGWANLIAYSENKKKYLLILSALLLCIPFFIYARGSSVGVILSIVVLIIIQKKSFKTYFIYFTIVILFFYSYTYFVNTELLYAATNVDLKTGEGSSGRYMLWEQGIDLARKAPILGHGFCTENGLYNKYFNGHMSHQNYIHYAVELGVINLFVYVISAIVLFIDRLYNYRKNRNLLYLIQFSALLSFFISDFFAFLLYFNKYAYIIFVLAAFSPTQNSINKNV